MNLVYNVQDLGRTLADQKPRQNCSQKKEGEKATEFSFGEGAQKKLDFSLKDKTNETIQEVAPDLEASRLD